MGFTSQVHKQNNFFDKDTLKYLQTKQVLLYDLYDLLNDLRSNISEEEDSKKIQIEVVNNEGSKIFLSLMGINSTSLVSSEMKGSITFTFIKDINEINRVEHMDVGPKSLGLKLIKTCSE